MSRPLLLLSSSVLATWVAAGTAAAGPAETASAKLEPYFNRMQALRAAPGDLDTAAVPDPKACTAAVADARKAGLADDAKIYSDQLSSSWDDAHFDSARRPYLELQEVGAMCDEYAALLKMIPAAAVQQESAEKLRIWSTAVKPGEAGSGATAALAAEAKRCSEVTDAAIKAGAPADRKIKIGERELTLAEGKQEICEAYARFTSGFSKDNAAAVAAERKQRAAKFVKAGMTGKRLEFFTDNFDVTFYGAGCRTISDPKQLAKATKLYNITIKPDGAAILWTTTFAGNKVSYTSRTYRDEAAANAGCK